MTHSMLKHALHTLATVGLALPLTIMALSSQQVAAQDTPAVQNVILTKYAYTNGQIGNTTPSTADDLTNTPDAKQDRVAGVKFTAYNVTDQYWTGIESGEFTSSVSAAKFKKNQADVVKTALTDANGQINYQDLPTHYTFNGQAKPAVYLFVEDAATAPDYDAQTAEFILSLPVKLSDGSYPQTVYVYPKNLASQTYDLEFTKQDAQTGATLANAEFQITNAAGLYAQVQGAKDNTVTGFAAAPVQVKWVSAVKDATTFVSDSQGKFGFTSYAETVREGATWGLKKAGDYHYLEIKAPNGYDKAQDGDINSQNGAADASLIVKDNPQGLLPHTGGKGTTIFAIIGLALIASGSAVYFKRRVG
ncbi:pilin N-terminal domain-containing protein [Lacticaseibacillus jixiensis]|uniref:pilin N-terminal domain-containing protein n=1 Tax=Lacticaseibacillus jixiensis TaxID=3231926 RepID=UPI0036F3DF30